MGQSLGEFDGPDGFEGVGFSDREQGNATTKDAAIGEGKNPIFLMAPIVEDAFAIPIPGISLKDASERRPACRVSTATLSLGYRVSQQFHVSLELVPALPIQQMRQVSLGAHPQTVGDPLFQCHGCLRSQPPGYRHFLRASFASFNARPALASADSRNSSPRQNGDSPPLSRQSFLDRALPVPSFSKKP